MEIDGRFSIVDFHLLWNRPSRCHSCPPRYQVRTIPELYAFRFYVHRIERGISVDTKIQATSLRIGLWPPVAAITRTLGSSSIVINVQSHHILHEKNDQRDGEASEYRQKSKTGVQKCDRIRYKIALLSHI